MTCLLLFWMALQGSNAPEPLPRGTSALLEKQLAILEIAAKSREQEKRYQESAAVLQEERLEWMTLRNRQTMRIQSFRRMITRKEAKLAHLVDALYRVMQPTRGMPHIREGRLTAVRDGRSVLLLLIERELREMESLRSDLQKLEAEREGVDQNIRELENLEENFRVLALEAEALVKQCTFEIHPMEKRLEDANRDTFDAQDWARWNRIRQIKAMIREDFSGQFRYRGMLVKPVPGSFLQLANDRPGAYLSAKPRDPVRSPEQGVVRFTGPVEGFGQIVVIEHEHHIHSIIGRLEDIVVKPGDEVRRAQFLGRVGVFSRAASVPVYVELRRGRESLDPRLWFRTD